MPPVSKSPFSKRKSVETPAAAPLVPDTLALSDEEESVPPEASSLMQETPEQMAKRQYLGTVTEACPLAKHTTGGGVSATVEGTVVRSTRIMVDGKGGKVPKIQFTVVVDKVSAPGCKDVLSPVEGFYFALPTRRLPASPEEIAKNANAKGPVILDVADEHGRANFLSTLSTSFYIDAPGKDKDDKNKGPNLETCTPGMRVLITGLSCEFGGKMGTALYTNAKRIMPIFDPVPAGEAAKYIISAARSPSAMAGNALLFSMCMKGFFGLNYPEPYHQQQADVCKAKWGQLTEGTAAKLENIALGLGKEEAMASTVSALNSHAARVRSISPEDAANGAPLFNIDMQNGCTTPYTATIVQYGVQSGTDPESGATEMCSDLFDPDKRDRLPHTFCEGKVMSVTTTGNLIQIDFRLFFVYDKTMAVAATREGKNPILRSTKAAASVKFTKKSLGPELLGTTKIKKIDMALHELIPYANMALNASIFPRGADDLQVDGHFCSTAGIDMVDGITKCGVQISEKWLDQKMLSGRGVFIHSVASDDVAVVEVALSAGFPPVLAKQGYQAVTEDSFDFDSLRVPPGKTRQYYVIYEGCAKDVGKKLGINLSVDEGEQHLDSVVPAVRDDGDFKAFLRDECIVYAVAGVIG